MARKPKPLPGQIEDQFAKFDQVDDSIDNVDTNAQEHAINSKKTTETTKAESKTDSSSIDVDSLLKYREELKRKLSAKAESVADKYPQQNIGIDRNIVAAIDNLLKSNNKKGKARKLTKKSLYNDALRMYLDVAFGIKVKSVEDE